MTPRLKGKIALVAGATRGAGRGISCGSEMRGFAKEFRRSHAAFLQAFSSLT